MEAYIGLHSSIRREGGLIMGGNYDSNVSKEVEKTAHEYKYEGRFKNRKQAIAVGLSKARQKGERVPEKNGG